MPIKANRIKPIIANRIKELRKERALTQRELGELSGISEQMIRDYEGGFRNPKIQNLQKIADALEVPISELMYESITVKVPPDCLDPNEMKSQERKSEMHIMDFIQKVKKAVKAQGKTLTEFFGMVGISKHTFYNWEKGSQVPLNQALKMINCLGLSADEFFQTDYYSNMLSSTDHYSNMLSSMMRYFNDLDDNWKTKKQLVALVKNYHNMNDAGCKKLFGYSEDMCSLSKYRRSLMNKLKNEAGDTYVEP